ncbi:ABC transporter substrate-binding protein [Kytococcus schroeteri]|uniref:ABC transporter substrate-binding protein n=1 Tax=Kytococcus schroeteri TaxID=138300 RepID=A0A2I1PDF2_9MICO|nr:ABC transporter substrate-binding protein [Kytococcus schroeteri]PKZ42634.1 ABC transporter substrate-binding protein [Kytococcus schroeteri]
MSTHRKSAAVAAAVCAAALTLSGCAESQRDKGGEGSGGGEQAAGGTLTFGAAGEPKLFDPFYATDGETFRITRQVFEGLLEIEPGTAKVGPGLATKWESNDDGTQWTFTLKEGVTFHDGTPFNAEAVCKNFERMYNQTGAGQSPSVSAYWQDTMGGFADGKVDSLYKGCKAPEDNKAVVTITEPTSKFPTMLTLSSLAMQSPTAMDKYKANDVKAQGEGFTYPEYATKHPTGTGPFTFAGYDRANKTIKLKRNEDYHGDKAKLDELIFKVIPDESTRKQELKAGSIDGYDLPNPIDWKSLEDEGNQVMKRDPFNILYLGLNAKENPKLKDPKVRRAIAMAINKEQLVKSQMPEGASVATQFMPDTVKGYNSEVEAIPHDTEGAKKLLKEAGAEDLTLEVWWPSEVSRPYMPDPQKIFEAIQGDLEAAGITVKASSKPWNGGYLDGVDTGKAQAYLLGWTGDYDSPDNFIGTFFGTTDNRFATGEYPWGKKLATDLKKADAIVDDAEREKRYQELNAELMDEQHLPAVPLTHSPPALVVSSKVQGLVASPLTAERFASASLSE